MSFKDGRRITKSGQIIEKHTIAKGMVINYAQNPTTNKGWSDNFSVRLSSNQIDKSYISLGSISEESIEVVSNFVDVIYELVDKDIIKFIVYVKSAIKNVPWEEVIS